MSSCAEELKKEFQGVADRIRKLCKKPAVMRRFREQIEICKKFRVEYERAAAERERIAILKPGSAEELTRLRDRQMGPPEEGWVYGSATWENPDDPEELVDGKAWHPPVPPLPSDPLDDYWKFERYPQPPDERIVAGQYARLALVHDLCLHGPLNNPNRKARRSNRILQNVLPVAGDSPDGRSIWDTGWPLALVLPLRLGFDLWDESFTREVLEQDLDEVREDIAGKGEADDTPASDGQGGQAEVDAARPPIKRPSDDAIAAWRLRDLKGGNQQGIADELAKQLRQPVSQGQVSRWLTAVKAYLAAGNVLPELPGLTHKPDTVAPRVIDMGERQDGLTKHQRRRRDPDSDD